MKKDEKKLLLILLGTILVCYHVGYGVGRLHRESGHRCMDSKHFRRNCRNDFQHLV